MSLLEKSLPRYRALGWGQGLSLITSSRVQLHDSGDIVRGDMQFMMVI